MKNTIIYTLTDEAPALATRSLLPVISAFASRAGVSVESRDISLAARLLAGFPEYLKKEQQVSDALAELGRLVQEPEANIIKLPNISASVPQLKGALKELQAKGYALPDYPEEPRNPEEKALKARFDKIKGSAVNPVLREGNSDRRAPASVKAHARKHPHSMGLWSKDSKSSVVSMTAGDFYGTERSVILDRALKASIVFRDRKGQETLLKDSLPLEAGEILDTAVMHCRALRAFLKEQKARAREQGILFSIHLKATMMKVSDPVIFGHALSVFFEEVFTKHKKSLEALGYSPDNGLGDLFTRLAALPEKERRALEKDLAQAMKEGPALAMVNSDKGITNLHVPSDVIIDASMPAAIRSSGKMWNPGGELQDTLFIIPDRSYAGVYAAAIEDCKNHGAFEPAVMGSVSNIGLMARKAEEYGSHDKTFLVPDDGVVEVRSGKEVLLSQAVEKGDLFRGCQTKGNAVQNWVELGVGRVRATGNPGIFWLDPQRAHDRALKRKVEAALAALDTSGLDIRILPPVEAARFSFQHIRQGRDVISITGNVLRDYLTDLFPIMELGTSAKMLSIVPLLNGGGLFETGAGGSAPRHVQQFVEEGHLRWDSLGEFLALGASLEHLAEKGNQSGPRILARCLDKATGRLLEEGRSPSRRTGEPDNRSSHFALCLFWAQELAAQEEDSFLKEVFTPLAAALQESEALIEQELLTSQGRAADLGGYYLPDDNKANALMRPSSRWNQILWDFDAGKL